jgi:predicted regulator of amino acid metabolism with ACT domain
MNHENKKQIPPIDEDLMMSIMANGVKKEGLELPSKTDIQVDKKEISKQMNQDRKVVKDKVQKNRNVEVNYESIFLIKSDTNARDGKTVYIRPAFHEKLTRIIQVIGEDKISIYAYLDNLLSHHFDEFGEQITKSYNDKHKPI